LTGKEKKNKISSSQREGPRFKCGEKDEGVRRASTSDKSVRAWRRGEEA